MGRCFDMNEDLVRTVYELNLAYYELSKNEDMTPFTLLSSGFVSCINFMGEQIYNDEDDCRMQDDEGNYTQTVGEYCIQEAIKVLSSLLPLLKLDMENKR